MFARSAFMGLLALTAACGGSSMGSGTRNAPDIISVTPAAGSPLGGALVTIAGTDFATSPAPMVTFGAAAAPLVGSTVDSLTVISPAHAAGAVAVTVTNGDGQVSNGLTFTFQVGTPSPTVGSVSPATGSTAGGRTVSIAGSSFSVSPANPRVRFGDQFAVVITATATLITASIPAHAPGAVAVTVTNPDAQASTLPAAFTYVAAPVLVSLSPNSGSTRGGEQVDLIGTSFDVATAPVVTFGNTPALVATGSTATSITVLTPAQGESLVDVTVTNSDGLASTLVNGFAFKAPVGNAPAVGNVTDDTTGRPPGAAASGEAKESP